MSLCMEPSNKRSKKRGPVRTQNLLRTGTCVVSFLDAHVACAAGKMYVTELNDLEKDSCGLKETLLS